MKIIKPLLTLVALLGVATTQAQIKALAYIDHLNPAYYDTLGNITITPSGGYPPYTYKWLPGNTSNKDLTNAKKNTYTLRVKDSHNDSVKYKYNIGHKLLWASFSGLKQSNDTLKNTGPFSWGSALSKNTFPANNDMWFEVVLNSGATYQKIGVLDSAFTLVNSCEDIDFGVYIFANYLQQIVNGAAMGTTVNYNPGDVFRLERIGNTINYVLNETVVWSTTHSSYGSKIWKVRCGLHDSSIPMVNVGCSSSVLGNTYFAKYIKILPVIIHNTDKDRLDGSVTPLAREPGLVMYTWQPGSVITATLDSSSKGIYGVLGQDYLNTTSYYAFPIDYKTKWSDFTGAKQQRDTLVNTGLFTWGSAVSKNVLKPGKNGHVDVVLTNNNTYAHMGFLDSTYSANTNTDIDLGIYKSPTSIQRIMNGTYYTMASWDEGDILRMERVGNTVNYRLNGVVIWTNTDATYSQKKWRFKAMVYESGAPVANIGCSFTAPLEMTVTKEHADYDYPYNAYAYLDLAGGTPPYKVLWKDSLNSNYRGDMVPGIYDVQVSDSAAVDTLNRRVSVGLRPGWLFNTNLVFTPDTAKTLRSDSLGLSLAGNMINKNTDGWVEIKVTKLADDYAFGFVGDNQDVFTQNSSYINGFKTGNTGRAYTLMQQAVSGTLPYTSHVLTLNAAYDVVHLVRIKAGTIYLLFRNSSDLLTYTYAEGDIIRVGRNASGNMYVAKNDVLLYTHSASALTQYLYPAVVLNGAALYARPIGTVKGGGVFNPAPVMPNVYAVPQVKLDGGFYTPVANRVLFTVEGEYNTMNLKFNVYSKTHAVVLSNNTPNLANYINSTLHNLGDNRYSLNVASLAPGFYILEVINEKNEKLYLRFKMISSGIVQNPNTPNNQGGGGINPN